MNQIEEIVEQSLLYDFYGELLTENRKRIYEAVVFHDLSLSEVAEQEGITRQGVFDMLKRTHRALAEYENKLGLVEKFNRTKKCLAMIRHHADAMEDSGMLDTKMKEDLSQIRRLADSIEELL